MNIARNRAAGIAALLVALASNDAVAWSSRAALDLLRPGSHGAVGFGGDPFLSPFDNETGWWSHLDLADAPGSRVVLDASRPADLGPGTGFESQDLMLQSTVAGRLARSPWTMGVGLERPRWEGGWEGGRGALSMRGSTIGGVDAAIRVRVLPSLTWQVGGKVLSEAAPRSQATFAAGLRCEPQATGLSIQGEWERARRPAELRSDLYDEPIAVSANLMLENQRIEGRWRTPLGPELEGAMGRTRWLPDETAAATPSYHVAPFGTSSLDQAGLRWRLWRGQLLLRWTHLGGDLEGDVSWWGESFGGLDYARGSLDSWLSAFELTTAPERRTWIEYENVRLAARARGHMESWPFTSTLVDLLGQRRIFRMEGAADWQRWHVAKRFPLRGRAGGRSGVEWVEISPRGEVESWRPAFLVFGKEDDRVDRLAVRRVQLGVVSLGATCALADIDLDLGVEQCVFARVRRSRVNSEAGKDPTPAGGRTDDRDRGLGTRLRFTASRRF